MSLKPCELLHVKLHKEFRIIRIYLSILFNEKPLHEGGVESYIHSDFDETAVDIAQKKLEQYPQFTSLPLDVVNGDYPQQKCNLAIISGGLTTMVLTKPEDALRALKKVYRSMNNQGFLILSGLMPHLIGPKEFAILNLNILNRVDIQKEVNERSQEYYVLQKQEKEDPTLYLDGKRLDCFVALDKRAKDSKRLSQLISAFPKEQLEKIQEIDLSETDVTTEELQALQLMPSLKTVRLAGCQNFDIQVLKECVPCSCHCLDLSHTPFNEQDIETLLENWKDIVHSKKSFLKDLPKFLLKKKFNGVYLTLRQK